MSVTIPGLPESVPRERVLSLLRELGFEPRELAGLRVESHAIIAKVYADQHPGDPGYLTGKRGRWRYVADRENAAMHRICIPITDAPTPEEKASDA